MKGFFLLILIVGSPVIFTACGQKPTFKKLDVATAESLLASPPEGFQILDLRTPPEIARTGMIPGARNLDISAPGASEKLMALPKDKPVLVYCATGVRSANTASYLKKLGHNIVYDLSPGIMGWIAAGKPVKR